MRVRNTQQLNKSDLYYCYEEDVHNFLYMKKVLHINKGLDGDKVYWIYFKSNLLDNALVEYKSQRG